jgi:hypothetical protein
MFLDDELYNLAKSFDYTKWQSKDEAASAMQKCVYGRITDECKKLCNDPKANDSDIIIFLRRCKTHWYNAIRKLHKEGIVLFYGNEGTFEAIIEYHPYFEHLTTYIKTRI